MLDLLNVVAVDRLLPLLFTIELSDAGLHGLPEEFVAIHQILLFAEDVQTCACEIVSCAHLLDAADLELVLDCFVADILGDPFQEVNIDEVLHLGQLIGTQYLIGTREVVDFWAMYSRE